MSMLRMLRAERRLLSTPLVDYVQHVMPEPSAPTKKFLERTTLRRVLRYATCVDAQNVADYYWTMPKDNWYLRGDFIGVEPTWDAIWFEWIEPSFAVSQNGKMIGVPPTASGALMLAFGRGVRASARLNHDMCYAYGDLPADLVPVGEIKETRHEWTEYWFPFITAHKQIVGGCVPVFISDSGLPYGGRIEKDGLHSFKISEVREAKDVAVMPVSHTTLKLDLDRANAAYGDHLRAALLTHLNVPMFALSLINASHSTAVRDVGDTASLFARDAKAAARLRENARADPLTNVRWTRVDLTGIDERIKLTGEGRSRAGVVSALHSVRGHRKRYGVEGRRLLFGKYTGQFWFSKHNRGESNVGKIIKSYRVEKVVKV